MATVAIGIAPDKSGSYTCRLPLSALMEGGVPPEEGDSVQFSVDGTVQSVQGDTAVVKIESVNGEPVSEEGEESPSDEAAENSGESTQDMGSRLRTQAPAGMMGLQ